MINRRTLLCAGAAITALAAFAPIGALYAAEAIFTGNGEGVAINGYDAVAYFTQEKPVKGTSVHTVEHEGAIWHFASAENRDLFAANPQKYAPQYGGYCAFAAAHNQLATTVPEAFTIRDGKLYLNYSVPVRKQWSQSRDGNIKTADANWPGLKPK